MPCQRENFLFIIVGTAARREKWPISKKSWKGYGIFGLVADVISTAEGEGFCFTSSIVFALEKWTLSSICPSEKMTVNGEPLFSLLPTWRGNIIICWTGWWLFPRCIRKVFSHFHWDFLRQNPQHSVNHKQQTAFLFRNKLNWSSRNIGGVSHRDTPNLANHRTADKCETNSQHRTQWSCWFCPNIEISHSFQGI